MTTTARFSTEAETSAAIAFLLSPAASFIMASVGAHS